MALGKKMSANGGDSDHELTPELVQPNQIDSIIAILEEQRAEIDKDLVKKMNEEISREEEKRNKIEEPLLQELQAIQKSRKEKLRQLRTFQEQFKKNIIKCTEARERTFLKFKDLQKSIEKKVTFS